MPWVPVEESARLPRGAVVGREVGDCELVVWRGVDGAVCVMDARCPHQWSYLGIEGVVDGNELVCAAHHWRFDAEGRGSKLNVLGRRDEKAPIQVFPVRERDGLIEARLPDAS